MNWREKNLHFSIRKLKVAVASIVVGISIFGASQSSLMVSTAHANSQVAQVPSDGVTVDYIYVNYEDLTPEQHKLLRLTDQDFKQLVAEKDVSYVLVYRPTVRMSQTPNLNQKSGQLPKTGELDNPLAAVMATAGIAGLIVLARKKNKQTALTVLVVTSLGAGVLTGEVTQALETGLKHFLIESHQVKPGDLVPQPSYHIDGLDFRYYIPQDELEGKQPTDISVQSQPNVSVEQPQSNQTDQPVVPAREPDLVQPVQTDNPSAVETVNQEDVAFETIVEEDANLPLGEEVVAQIGQVGRKENRYINGQLVASAIIKSPVNQIIKRGTKLEMPKLAETVRYDDIAFETIVEEDANLPLGEEVLVQEGQLGRKSDRYIGEQLVSSQVIQAPVNKVVKRGTKATTKPVETLSQEDIDFEIKVEIDDNMALGEEVLVQEGQKGRRENKYLDGRLVSSKVVKEPVTKIVKRGTKVILAPVETTDYEDIDFDTKVEIDDNMALGEEVLVQEGQKGRRENKYLDGRLVSSKVVKEPVTKIVKRGTKVILAPVETTDYEDIDFDTKVEVDDNMALGEEVLVQEGQKGRRENKYLDGRLVSSKVVKEPVTKIVKRGTKVILAPVETTDYEDIDFDTKVEIDDNMALGEEVLVQEGQKGRRENKYLDGRLVSSKVVKEPVTKIVKRGTKVILAPVETTDYEDIDFDTKVEIDDNMALGEEVLVQEGQKGRRENKYLDGRLVSSKVVKEPVTKIVKRGTKVILAPVETTDYEDIDFETKVETDDNMALGEEVVIQEGQKGRRENKYLDGRLVSSQVVKEPVTKIVKRGTKVDGPKEPVHPALSYESVDFETIIEEDPSLPLGEEVVVQEGQKGRREDKYLDGKLVSSQIIKEPVAQIIKRGTKVVAPVETTDHEDIDFEIKVETDENLALGEEVVVQEGQKGRRENRYVNGQLVSSQIVKEPVTQIIKRGTKVVAPVETTDHEDIDFETKVETDENLALGEEVVVQEGQKGRRENKYLDGKLVSSQIVKEPVTQIVKRGSKVVAPVETTNHEDIDFETKVETDENLALGEEVVVQEGQKGRRENKYLDGKLISSQIVKEPVTQIIKRGIKVSEPKGPIHPALSYEAVDFDTIVEEDPNLPLGEEVLVQAGEKGRREDRYLDGKLVSSHIVKEPVAQIIKRGTKVAEPVETTDYQDINFETKVEMDESLPLGEEVIVQEGQQGRRENKYLDGQLISSHVVKEPLAQIVKRGTKVIAPVETTKHEDIDFETKIEVDNDLPLGEEVIVREGQKGRRENKYLDGQLVSSHIVKEPLAQIVKRGTKVLAPVETTDHEDIDFETKVEIDDNLPLGEEILVQAGEKGRRENKYLDGQLVSSHIVKEPLTQVIRRGIKVVVEPVETIDHEDINFVVDIEEDATLPLGEEVVVQVGENGRRENRYLDGQLVSSQIVKEPVTQIVKRGTKVAEPVELTDFEDINFEIDIEEDATLPLGEEVVVQAGENGRRENRYLDGQLVSSQIVKEPVTQIVKRGTKVVVPVETTDFEDIEFDIDVEEDASLPLGEEQVVTVGEKGRRENRYLDGQLVSSQIVKEPVTQIVKRGTKVAEPVELTDFEDINFEIDIEEDATLPLGEEVVVQAGENGRRENRYLDGQLVSSQIVKEPVTQIVKRGTKVVVPVETTDFEDIEFDIDVEEDASLPLGEEQVVTVGEKGRRENRYLDGQLVSSQIVKEPVTQIVKRGTKVVEPVETIDYEDIDFAIDIEEDATLPLGEELVVTAGEKGRRENKYLDGQLVSSQVIKEPVTQIIKHGTKVALDKTALLQALEDGEAQLTGAYTSDSKANLEAILENSRAALDNADATQELLNQHVQAIKAAIAGLVALEPQVEVVRETIPFDVIEMTDANLLKGVRVVDQVGKPGEKEITKTDGVVTSERIITPVQNEFVRLGSLELDKQTLGQVIEQAEQLVEEDYRSEEWAGFQLSLEEAQAIFANPNVTQQQVDQATAELRTAMAALVVDKERLKATILEAEALTETDYTPESWSALLEALAVARDSRDDEGVKQASVNQATTQLQSAISGLTTDKSALESAISEARAKVAADYTTASYEALTAVLAQAEAVFNNDTAKQSEIAAKTAQLKSAISGLTTDKSALESAISEARAKVAGDYTTASYEALTAVLAQAEAVFNTDTAKQSEITAKTAQLQSAISGLTTDKFALESAISEARAKVAADYTAASYEALTAVLTQAEAVFNNDTAKQSEITAKTAQLKSAISGLTTDKSALDSVISEARGKVAADYTAASYEALTAVLTQAEAVFNNDTAKQSEIAAKTAQLQSAISGLTTDKSALDSAISEARGKVSADYTVASYEALTAVLTQAEAVFNNDTAKQSEIAAKTAQLQSAIAGLTTDKSALDSAISEARGKVAADYTAASYEALTAVLTQAEALNSKASAKQSEIAAKTAQLKSAISGLTTDKSALDSAISEARGKVAADYTAASYEALTAVLTQAEAVFRNNAAKQSEIAAKTAQLQSAISGLTTDKSALDSVISEARGKVAADYTAASYEALTAVLTQAEAVFNNDTAKQSEITAKTAQLQSAISGLTTDKSALDSAISEARGKVAADYTAASYEALTAVLTQAEALNSKASAKQSEIAAKTAQLKSAIAGLTTDKSALESAISEARAKVAADYTTASYEALTAVLTQAEALNSKSSAKQSEITAKTAQLQSAIAGLTTDKSALESAISEARGKVAADYTAASYEALTAVLTQAEAVFNNDTAKQSEIAAKTAELQSAISGLTTDKSALESAISEARGKVAADYTAASYEALTVLLGQAEAVFSDQAAKQSEIAAKTTQLQSAISGLTTDKSALDSAISEARAKVAADYTTASYEALTAVLTQAEAVFSDKAAKQSEIAAKTAQLQSAISGLTTDKSALESAISEARAKVAADYTADSYEALTKALGQAEAVFSNNAAKQSEIAAKTAQLKSAISGLTTDKSALDSAISEARGKVAADYTATSYEALTAVLTQAEALTSNPSAKQSEIAAKTAQLQSAISGLTTDKSALDSAISEARGKVAADYTAASYEALTAVLTQAEAVFSNNAAKQSEITAKTAQLKSAISGLTTDKSALDSAISEARAKVAADYTAASYEALTAVLAQAEAVFSNNAAKQSEIAAKTAQLQSAISGLTTDKSALDSAISEARGKVAVDYTAASYEALTAVLAQAEALTSNPSAKQSEIVAKTAQLKSAISGLTTDKSALESAISEARAKVAADYTVASYEALTAVLTQAEAVFNTDTAKQSEIAAKTAQLKSAIAGLTTDKSALESAISEARGKVAADYTAASYEALTAVLTQAEAVFSNNAAKQSEIAAKTAQLKSAISGLTTDKSALESAISEARAKVAADYTAASYEALTAVLTQAEAVFSNNAAKQSEIAAKTAQLQSAISTLVRQQQVPSLTWNSLIPNDPAKTARASFTLNDPSNAYRSLSLAIYNGSRLVQTLTLRASDLAGKEFSLPEYDVTYTFKPTLVYNLGNGERRVEIESRTLELEFKKIEIKDVDRVTLYQHVNGEFVEVTALPARLSSVDNYLVRVSSDRFKDMLLPVKSITVETLPIGVTGYRVTTAIDEMVEDRDSSARINYVDNFSFLIAREGTNVKVNHNRQIDYTILEKAQQGRQVAYENMEKLIPFYNKGLIVKYGNLIDTSHDLYRKKLLSVTPMKNGDVVTDVYSIKESLNRLMLHYEDGTIGYLTVTYKGDFRNQGISEYSIDGTKLIYTPDQFLSDYSSIVNDVLPELEAVDYGGVRMGQIYTTYNDRDVLNKIIEKARAYTGEELPYIFTSKMSVVAVLYRLLGVDIQEVYKLMDRFESESITELSQSADGIREQMEMLYLQPTFNTIKGNLAGTLRQLLASDKSLNTTGGIVNQYVANYIKANKEKLLLGLSYMQRWYNIDFQNVNIRDIATYHQDFFGKPVNTLEWLVDLGSTYANLLPANNVTTYASYIAPNTNKANLVSYLTANRELFTNYKDDNTWFKETSKAYIVEQQSEVLKDRVVRVYDALTAETQQNGILPLLTAREGIFIISTLGNITYGMFDRYYDDNSRPDYDAYHGPGLTKEQKDERIKGFVRQAAKRQGDFFDVWYRILPTDIRDRLIKPSMPVWDGYRVRGKWLSMVGPDTNDAILDFFGPVGHRASGRNNGAGAYAEPGDKIIFVNYRVLDSQGTSTYTHEMVHQNDNDIYLGGHGRRDGLYAEAFAMGLLQSSNISLHAANFLTINMIFDLSAHKDSRGRLINVSPERFKSATDLKDYMHGVFDVLYTLDYAEAQAASNLTIDQKITHYGVIENVMDGVHAKNKIRAMTRAEANLLTNWERFIDRNVIGLREYSVVEYPRNGYYYSFTFTPNYAALSNNQGAPGELMFRRIAFELLADRGYEEGFIPYTSNKLKPNAQTTLTDEHVLRGIYGQTYRTWADFKKAMFRDRINQRHKLAPVTFVYQGKRVELTSFEQLQTLMNQALAEDVANGTVRLSHSYMPRVHLLKQAIFNAYIRETNDFETSIYLP